MIKFYVPIESSAIITRAATQSAFLKMDVCDKIQVSVEGLNIERDRLLNEGWYLQYCWLVRVKPGGTARTDRQYWQVRSRLELFDGKKLKHLHADEVEDYRAAILRGRKLQQIDRQIAKLRQ
jgi:hypothetical protein